MDKDKFPIDDPRRLKDWINNVAKKNKIAANTVLQNYMMERFLERVISPGGVFSSPPL